jgi:BirA family transcriptional regulator, biotin operon repressor / biotin---[acetyl-CoA-carboxylase] ligase
LLSAPALALALEHAGLRAPVRFEEVTPSTQAAAVAMAEDGAPEWSLVAAGHQTRGRGRGDRIWHAEIGAALLFSVVLRPTALEPRLGGIVTLLAGSAMAEAIDEVADQRATCKWPNDVLIAGRKAVGILATSEVADGAFRHVVLGVGANLGEAPASVPGAGAIVAGDAELLEAFLARFAAAYEPAHPAFPGAVLARYRDRCSTLGERVVVRTAGESVEGLATDLDEAGGLVVRTSGGERVVRFGDVEHLGGPPLGLE